MKDKRGIVRVKNNKLKTFLNRSPIFDAKAQFVLLAMIFPAFAAVVIFNYIPMVGVSFAIREVDFKSIWSSPFADPLFKYFSFFENNMLAAFGIIFVYFPFLCSFFVTFDNIKITSSSCAYKT